jgi:transglutaminase-like putative cysteine protease
MLKYISPTILLLFFCKTLHSQDINVSSLLIPKELKQNANAIVRISKTTIDVLDTDDMIISVERTVTVLNKLGNNSIGAVVGYDDNSRINKLEAFVYDAFGNEIKKIKKNDFVDVSAVDGATLYSDSRVKYFEYTPITYPYTVCFSYQKKTSSTGFLPNWSPIEGYSVSIENNSYQVNLKKGTARIKEKFFDGFEINKSIDERKIYYTIKNVEAIKYESSSPSLQEYKPIALVALNDFKTDGVNGSYKDWKEFGFWMTNALLKDRNSIDDVTKNKVLSLVSGVENPLEKAKIVYQFMQDKTRYISVQVGIGGIQPIAASEVDRLGYGDCKGLTNYTKALLDLVGVTSYYTHVEAGAYNKVSFDKDFASLEQGNHVILNIPNNKEDIWLECTSQTMPFGFLGDFTDDRDVLVVTPEGGIIKRTASYKDDVNLQTTNAAIELTVSGDVIAKLHIVSKGIQYDTKFQLESFTENELIKNYKSNRWNYNNNLEVTSFKLLNDKENVVFTEDLELSIKNYASINENEYLFRVNVFNVESYIPKRYRTRNLPLKINRGYKDIDAYIIKIPATHQLEYLPEFKEISTKFGTYSVSFNKIDETTFSYKKSILIKEGMYPKEDYELYRDFRRSIVKAEGLRIALIKK